MKQYLRLKCDVRVLQAATLSFSLKHLIWKISENSQENSSNEVFLSENATYSLQSY